MHRVILWIRQHGKNKRPKSSKKLFAYWQTGVYSITSKGTDADVREQFPEVFSGIGKLADFHDQLKLHVNRDVKPVAQPIRRLPFGLRDKVDEKLDELFEKDIIEEVSSRSTLWVSPLVVVPK